MACSWIVVVWYKVMIMSSSVERERVVECQVCWGNFHGVRTVTWWWKPQTNWQTKTTWLDPNHSGKTQNILAQFHILLHTLAHSRTLSHSIPHSPTISSSHTLSLTFTHIHTHLYTKTPHSNRLWTPLINDSASRSNLSQNDSRAFRKVFGYMRKSSRRKKATFNGKNH